MAAPSIKIYNVLAKGGEEEGEKGGEEGKGGEERKGGEGKIPQ